MGCDNAIEAEQCCMPKRETIPSSDTHLPKYSGYAGDQEWKYVRDRRLADELWKLGERW